MPQINTEAHSPAILVVDGDDGTRKAVCRLFTTNGYRAHPAYDQDTALAALSDDVAAIVSDFALGSDGDGLELLAAIARRKPELPAVMMTAEASAELAERAMKQGIDIVMRKPFECDELLAAVRDVLGSSAPMPGASESSEAEAPESQADYDSGIFRGGEVPDLDEAMSMIAHDLRGSLMTLLVAVDELKRSVALDSRERRLVEVADRSARQLESLASELSELGSAGSGRLELRRDDHDLADLIRGAVSDLSMSSQTDARIVPRLQRGIRARVDGHRLGRAIINVVNNALRFATSAVVVTLEARDDQARIIVEDDGPGIPENLFASVFEPFVRGDRRGSGLGLAITREVVRAHGGRVSAKNRDDGPGARFELWVPTVV